jgi:hippurate hydrolase
VFVFQPAEEHGQGAAAMLEDGLIERFGIDCFHALHNMPGLPAGTFATREGVILGAEDNFRIELRGRGGHSSRPDRTEDPIVPGAHLALALQSIVSRHLDPRETAVVSITEIVTDGTRNVLPFTVALDGDVRHASDAVSAAVEARMRSLATGIAAVFGLTASVSYTRVFAPTENAPETTRAARAAALRVAGPGGLRETLPETAADDVGRLFRARPGTLSFIGNGTEGAHGAPLHAETYDFNDAIIGAGAGYFLALLDAELGLGAEAAA